MITAASLWKDLRAVRSESPLIHNITNYVVMNTTANALLAVGASPVMAHAPEEVEEMTGIARALVVNIGTLSAPWIESMKKALRAAAKRSIPIVLDPVGAGATRFRTQTVLDLLAVAPPSILRGNASEILAIARAEKSTKGVDSTRSADEAREAAIELSERYRCSVSISGATDVIVNGSSVTRVSNGHPMMTKVTGLGCTASALTGAFAAVNTSTADAAAHAMAVMGIAGEQAAERSPGPGSLQMHFLDALFEMDESEIVLRLKAE